MITFQENTHFSQALPCTKEEFWAQVRKPNTAWRIDARRAIIAAVEASKTQGQVIIQTNLDCGPTVERELLQLQAEMAKVIGAHYSEILKVFNSKK